MHLPMLTLLLLLLTGCPELHKSMIPVKTSFPSETTLFMGPAISVRGNQSANLESATAQATGNEISVLFANAKEELNNESDPSTICWKGTLELPINPGKMRTIKHTTNIPRYHLYKDKDATVSLEFTFSGKTFSAQYASTEEVNEDVNKLYTVQILPNKHTSYVINYILKIERKSPKATVKFTWDSLDIGGYTGDEKYPDTSQ